MTQHRPTAHRARRAPLLATAGLVAGVLLLDAGCSAGESPRYAADGGGGARAARPAAAVAASPSFAAESTTVDAPLTLPAQLYVEHDAVVPARAPGLLDSLFVDVGARVSAGDLLATVESVDQRIALDSAEAASEAAELLVRRARTLTHAGGMTGADSEAVEFQYRQAQLALAKARRGLELTRVVAPFAGVVAERRARPQRLVAAGDTLFRVAESGPLLARVHVPEDAAAALRLGARATVVGVRGSSAGATVLRIAPAIDAASGTREVVLRVAQNGAFLPGSGVTVSLGAERRRALVVPREAIGVDGYALVDGRVEVVGGLAPGERVARPAP
jgi:RND family efflux transporter MFP subunit